MANGTWPSYVSSVRVRYSNEEIAACFNELDKDGNGVLSPEEVTAVIQEKMGFQSTDTWPKRTRAAFAHPDD